MNSWTIFPECNALGGKPTQIDKDDYKAAYRPAAVTDVKGEADGQAVTLTWDQSDVFVESELEIQHWNGTEWAEGETVSPSKRLHI